ncbi:MAG: YihY/virulence factor BrkB family protein, partial [Gammaproteobacteria bacterium]
ILSVLKGLGVHNAMEPTLLTLLEPLGNRSAEVTADILSYVDNLQVELIGVTSVGVLIYIVLDMMRKIEVTFNYIWAVKQGRSWASRVSEYLFAVIVSPLLLFMSISMTSYVNTNLFERFLENLGYGVLLLEFLAFVTPLLLMSLAFAFVYSFLPNTRVQFSSAFIGGLVTTIIWKSMGVLFQEVMLSAARESIYLAFMTAIAVLFFTYFGWLAALTGSSIAFYHQNPDKTRTGRDKLALSLRQQEILSLTLASLIIRRFENNEAPMGESELAASISKQPLSIAPALESLQEIGLITPTNESPTRYLPTHAVKNCTMVEIWRALRKNHSHPLQENPGSPDLQAIKAFQEELDNIVARELGQRTFIDSNV